MDVSTRWELLADHSATRIDDHILTFRDAHFCLALAAAGRTETVRDQLASMVAFAKDNDGWTAKATASTLIPLCDGIVAYEAGDYEAACDILWPMRNDLAPVGGSHTQRDLFRQILEDAAVKGNCTELARTLFSERLAQVPGDSMYQAKYVALGA